MKFQVQVAGAAEPLIVEVLSDDGGVVHTRVGDRELSFELAQCADGRQLVTQGARQHVLDVVGRGGEYEILDSDGNVSLQVVDERDTWLGTGAGADASGTITVAMPGRVVAVLVQPGQAVTKGERLLIIEAMKMENDVSAPRDGVIKAIHVAEGNSVEAGQTLAELE